jgi:hypothetical protein
MQRIKLTEEGFKVTSVSRPLGRYYAFDEIERIWMETDHRPWTSWGWSRRGAITSIHVQWRDGSKEVLCRRTSQQPIWSMAAPHMMRQRVVPDVRIGDVGPEPSR